MELESGKVALFGAAGAIGQSIAAALKQAGRPYRVVEMHYLLTDPVILDDSALQQLIGPIAKTPYPEGIRQTLAATRPTP